MARAWGRILPFLLLQKSNNNNNKHSFPSASVRSLRQRVPPADHVHRGGGKGHQYHPVPGLGPGPLRHRVPAGARYHLQLLHHSRRHWERLGSRGLQLAAFCFQRMSHEAGKTWGAELESADRRTRGRRRIGQNYGFVGFFTGDSLNFPPKTRRHTSFPCPLWETRNSDRGSYAPAPGNLPGGGGDALE